MISVLYKDHRQAALSLPIPLTPLPLTRNAAHSALSRQGRGPARSSAGELYITRDDATWLPSPRSRTFMVSDKRSPSGEDGAQRRVSGRGVSARVGTLPSLSPGSVA
jgi:hypothetical protein